MKPGLALLLLAAAFAETPFAQTAKKPAPAPPPPLEAPHPVLAWMYPAGGQRGTTVEATLSGTGITPETVLVTGGGVTAKMLESKDPKVTRLSIAIAADAAPGERELRVSNAGGVSNRFRFHVGTLPEVLEKEPNSEPAQAQVLAGLPVVVNGQILEADRDYFRFHAKATETLVIAAQARGLLPFIADAVPGWFDPVLVIYDAAGHQLHFADDFRSQPDPVIFFHPPADGEYTLELRDVIYRGRGDFVYRLTVGAVPYVSGIFPLGGQRGTTVPVELRGANLSVQKLDIAVPASGARVMRLTPNALPFAASELPSLRASGDNHTPALAQRVKAPVTIDGRIETAGASDYYTITARQGERLVMEVMARRLESPLDSILTLYNSKQVQVAENDDWSDPLEAEVTHQADSRVAYTFPAAGDYTLRLRDVQGKGGAEYAYRLLIAPPKPDFTLRITPDNPRMGQGDTAAITVTAVRTDEFTSEIGLDVEGLPTGFSSSHGRIAEGQTEGRLTITAPADAKLTTLSPAVVGTAKIGSESVRHTAEAAESMMQAFAFTHILPTRQLFLAVVPPAGFTMSVKREAGSVLEVKPDSETQVVVRITRLNGVKNQVTVLPLRLANGTITTKTAQVPPEQEEVSVTLVVSKDAKIGMRQDIIISGVMRAGATTLTRFAQAIPIVVVAGAN